MHQRTWLALPLLAAIAASACQAAPAGLAGARFGLGANDPAALPAMPAAAPAAVPQAAPVGAMAASLPGVPAVAVPPAAFPGGSGAFEGGMAPASSAGTVTVDLPHALATLHARRLLATVADVDHVVAMLLMPGQAPRVQVVTLAQLAAGQSSVTFGGLPTGTATVTITAYDGVGTQIGTASQAAAVTAGQTTSVAIDVPIDPAVVAVPAASGGAHVAITFSQATPTPVPAGTVVQTITMPITYLTADGHGNLYGEFTMGLGSGQGSYGYLQKFSSQTGKQVGNALIGGAAPGGVKPLIGPIACVPAMDLAWCDAGLALPQPNSTIALKRFSEGTGVIVTDGAGSALRGMVTTAKDATTGQLVKTGSVVLRKALDGTTTTTAMQGYASLAFDRAGNLWADWAVPQGSSMAVQTSLHRYTPDGTLDATAELGFVPSKLHADGQGALWVSDALQALVPGSKGGTKLVKLAPDGSVILTLAKAVQDFCIDEHDNVWLATGASLEKIAPDGTTLGTFPLAAGVVVSGDGYIYAGLPTGNPGSLQGSAGKVVKVAP